MKPLYRLIAIAAFVAPAAALSAPAPQPAPEAVPGPRYMMTHIEVSREATAMTLAAIKANPKLSEMKLVKLSRLSVSPVTKEEWDEIVEMSK